MRRLTELDFMLGVHDLTRTGALRFRRGPAEPFIDDHALPAPPVTHLRELAAIAQKIEQPGVEDLPEYDQWLAMLIATTGGHGNTSPTSSPWKQASGSPPQTASNSGAASYLDLVDFLEAQGGAGLADDLQQLFRRAVFNLLVGNRDDHLRNHGFIRLPTGWRLSQAFDLNPNRDKRQHALTWDGRTAEPDLEALRATAPFYRIARPQDARAIIDEVTKVVGTWRAKAKALQMASVEVQGMEAVFAV